MVWIGELVLQEVRMIGHMKEMSLSEIIRDKR
jgi:hypothetical protein